MKNFTNLTDQIHLKNIIEFDPHENQIKNYVDKSIISMKQRISLHEVLQQNNLPQRCLQHNNVLTLYCQNDRKPLCVSCMYKQSDHKNHKVFPLSDAHKFLMSDTHLLILDYQKNVNEIQKIINISGQNLLKIQKIYPQFKQRIQMNYNRLYNILKQKQSMQLKQLYHITQNLRKNHLFVVQQYNKLLNFYLDHNYRKLNYKQNDQILLFTRNILDSLTKKYKFQIQIKTISQSLYPEASTKVYEQIENYIINKIEPKKFPEIILVNKQSYNQNGVQLKEEKVFKKLFKKSTDLSLSSSRLKQIDNFPKVSEQGKISRLRTPKSQKKIY